MTSRHSPNKNDVTWRMVRRMSFRVLKLVLRLLCTLKAIKYLLKGLKKLTFRNLKTLKIKNLRFPFILTIICNLSYYTKRKTSLLFTTDNLLCHEMSAITLQWFRMRVITYAIAKSLVTIYLFCHVACNVSQWASGVFRI